MEKDEILIYTEFIYENNAKWIYEFNYENSINKKNIINSAFKFFTNKENNELNLLSYLSPIDIYLNTNKLKIIFPNININNLISTNELLNLTNINLSKILYIDIKPFCECEHFINLKYLKICDDKKIENLGSFKNARFVNLKELYLVANDLKSIEFLKECPFFNVLYLDCSQNSIEDIPYLNFPKLNNFNLFSNNISDIKPLYHIGSSVCTFILGGNKNLSSNSYLISDSKTFKF